MSTSGRLVGASGSVLGVDCCDAFLEFGRRDAEATGINNSLVLRQCGLLRSPYRASIVEPFANDRIEDNLNTIGRLFYCGSTTICCPHSLSEEVGMAPGNQAGERRLAEIFDEAGFSDFHRATENPFNRVFEARL